MQSNMTLLACLVSYIGIIKKDYTDIYINKKQKQHLLFYLFYRDNILHLRSTFSIEMTYYHYASNIVDKNMAK